MNNPAKKYVTADELLWLPSDGYRYELVQGVFEKRALADEQHGELAMALGWRLAQFVSEHGLGEVYAAETGFKLRADPDTVRAPDASFVSRARLEDAPTGRGYRQGPPDLAVVVSPNDRPLEVAEKVYEWLLYGAAEVWVLDPERRSVTVYRPGELRILGEQDTLRSPLRPEWALPLSELFA